MNDKTEENSFSSVSSTTPGPLSPLSGPMGIDIGDLHDVPINDNIDTLSTNATQSNNLDDVCILC